MQRKLINGDKKKQKQKQKQKQISRSCLARCVYKQRFAASRIEVATALQMHRASVNEAGESLLCGLCPFSEPEATMKAKRNLRMYPGAGIGCSYTYSLPLPLPLPLPLETPSNFSHPASTDSISQSSHPVAPSPVAENPNIPQLPVQTLGLNLNFHHFQTTDTTFFCHDGSRSIHACSSVCYAAAAPPPLEVPNSIALSEEVNSIASGEYGSNIPTGESEKDLQSKEAREELDMKAVGIDDDYLTSHNFIEFPEWLNIDDDKPLQEDLNYQCLKNYFHDPELTCMGIEDIEDVDGADWLA